jgi:hypothetical protein
VPSPDEKQPKDELAEVERAPSVLQGRTPEAMRAEREARESRERREAALAKDAASARSAARRRGAIAAVAVMAVVGLGGFGLRARARAAEVQERVRASARPFVAEGFALDEPGIFDHCGRAAGTIAGGTCALAFAADPGAELVVAHGSAAERQVGPLLLCPCADEPVSVEAGGKPVGLLRVDAKAIGGPIGAAFLPTKAARVAGGGEVCAEESLQAWVAAGKYPRPKPGTRADWEAAAPGLVASGLAPLASLPADAPLAVVDGRDGACFVARTLPGVELSLAVGGTRRATGTGVVSWCTPKGATAIVERSGAGPLLVGALAARRVGGTLGLVRLLARAGLGDVAPWVAAEDRPALASEALRAVLAVDVRAVGQGPVDMGASERIAVFGTDGPSPYVADSSSTAFFLCSPELAPGVRQAWCVQNAPQTWHPASADAAGGAAVAALPSWMAAWSSVKDGEIVRHELAMLDLALRLATEGFEPAVIEGVTELDPQGVEILGRSGEDAVVAVGLWPAPPYVAPYTDDAPWTLSDAPRVVALEGGKRVRLRSATAPTVPSGARRTVVFRRSTKR